MLRSNVYCHLSRSHTFSFLTLWSSLGLEEFQGVCVEGKPLQSINQIEHCFTRTSLVVGVINWVKRSTSAAVHRLSEGAMYDGR